MFGTEFRELFQSSESVDSRVYPGRCPELELANAFGVPAFHPGTLEPAPPSVRIQELSLQSKGPVFKAE
jgi:hypothetical protein